jgi:hypothetical protein
MKLAKKSIPFDHIVTTRASRSALPTVTHAPTLAAPILQLTDRPLSKLLKLTPLRLEAG